MLAIHGTDAAYTADELEGVYFRLNDALDSIDHGDLTDARHMIEQTLDRLGLSDRPIFAD